MADRRPRVLAVASGGGHWSELMRIREAFADCDVAYVSVKEMYRDDVAPQRFYAIPDVSRLQRWSIVSALVRLTWILLRERPAVLVTTGSAPGMLALRLAKLLGARTVWIDSVANVEEMSLSGCKARGAADLWLTQWPHLARPQGPHYRGSVL